MPEGPLAILPLPGNRSSIVWSETEANAAAIQALSDEEYLAALRPRFGDFLGQIRWRATVSPIRSRSALPPASPPPASRWWVTRPMACTPSRARG